MFAGTFLLAIAAVIVIATVPVLRTTMQVGIHPPLCPVRGSITTVLTPVIAPFTEVG